MITAAIKFLRKQPLRWSERIGRIDDDQVIFRFAAADKLQGIFKMDMNAAVIEAAGIARQIIAAGFDNGRIHFYQIDRPYPVIARQFPHDSAVPGTDDQDILALLMYCHGHMSNHFIIDKFIPFGKHDVAIKGQDAAKFRCFKNIDALIFALPGIQMAVNADTVLDIGRMKFTEPKFHDIPSFHARTLMCCKSGSSDPVMLQPFSLA